jgi:two-component system, NtrC family, sensor kinase
MLPAGMQEGGSVMRVCSVRTGRWGLPFIVLAVGCAATAAFAWQASAHQQTVASLELAILRSPRKDALIAAIARLLPLLQDDEQRSISEPEYALRAMGHSLQFEQELARTRALVKEQRERCQELAGPRQRRAEHEDPVTKAMFGKLEADLAQLGNIQMLADVSPLANDPREALPHAPYGPLTRRAATIAAFRQAVHSMLAWIDDARSDPALRLLDQFHEAQLRVLSAWRCALVFLIGSALGAAAIFLMMDRSIWRPLLIMRRVLEGIAHRRYTDVVKPRGATELVQMFGSISAICERGRCSEDDREKEVEDRSKQRVRSERLAGIGLLATSVAHEINNPLTAIVGAADGLTWRLNDVASKLPPDDAEIVREYLKMIVTESKRCRQITTKLLDFARGREGERALYDVTAIVNDVVGMFRHMREYSGRTVDVNRQDPVRAWCNGPELKQVVLNLVANALQATPDGGRLDIRISSSPDTVEVVFVDNGSGMTAETLEHIFDPFFSTKGPGAGTGLGLSISHAIVEKHDGVLEAHSAGPGKGSTFRLRLPATELAAKATQARRAA